MEYVSFLLGSSLIIFFTISELVYDEVDDLSVWTYASLKLIDVVYPDIEIALWKSPLDLSVTSKEKTLCPPADSPKIVTLSGSPPKRAIFSFTQWSAAIMSKVPKFEVLSKSVWKSWIEGW